MIHFFASGVHRGIFPFAMYTKISHVLPRAHCRDKKKNIITFFSLCRIPQTLLLLLSSFILLVFTLCPSRHPVHHYVNTDEPKLNIR